MRKLLPVRAYLLLKFLFVFLIASNLNSCVTFFYPKKQTVIFNTSNKDATVYVNKNEAGKGFIVTEKVKKDGIQQVVTRAPGYKDSYSTIVQTRWAAGFWLCILLDTPVMFSLIFDQGAFMVKGRSFEKEINLPVMDKLVMRRPGDKYINISNIGVDIQNKKNIRYFQLDYTPEYLMNYLEDAEKKEELEESKEDAKARKNNGKGPATKVDYFEKVRYDDTKFSENVYNTLRSTDFIDTVNRVFSDNNNTMVLEGNIHKLYLYNILGKAANKENDIVTRSYFKAKVFLTWYVKNTYNEIIDSLETKEYSGDFVIPYGTGNDHLWEKMVGDAIDMSYLKLQKDLKFTQYLKAESNFASTDSVLLLNAVTSGVTEQADASIPSVIIKTKDGYGSGFAITQDGYIITNYHVVAGKFNNKLNSIKVITSAGQEVEATVVRYNKHRDLALIKVDSKFDKAFRIPNAKSFKDLMEVYVVAAPKSIELCQSIASGIVSSERKANNNNLVQLGLSATEGSGGGPVFDKKGTLHGVLVSKLIGENTEGVSFAIPAYLIREYLNIHYQ
jgi:hypothetical protein